MKKLVFILIAVGFSFLAPAGEKLYPVRKSAGEPRPMEPRGKREGEVARVVPHMAVNSEWTSELIIRSDSDLYVQDLRLEFYDADGYLVTATFYDSFGDVYTTDVFGIPDLQPGEVYALDFDVLQGARNMQVHVVTNELDVEYGLEGKYNRFRGGSKIAAVGVPVVAPDNIFKLNLDQRYDPITGNKRFRGIAVGNVDGLDWHCDITLYNQYGDSKDDFGVSYPTLSMSVPGFGKWVGDTYALYPDIDQLLSDGMGYLLFECDNPASVLGLAFEENTALVTSVPIEYFIPVQTKKGKVLKKRN